MAEEKDKKVVDLLNINEENIEEVINSGAEVTKEIAEASAKKIAEKRKEEMTERLVNATLKSEYTRKSSYLSMKKTKKEMEIKKNYLKKFSEKDDKLRNGGISLEDYEKECKQIYKDANNLIREVGEWYDSQLDKLLNQYPEARYSWRYDSFKL
jgi:polyribonucleotide nucleotidyltransferase